MRAGDDALTAACVIAQQRFRDQVAKSGLAASVIREAALEVHKSPRAAILVAPHDPARELRSRRADTSPP